MTTHPATLSIIVPCRNERDCIESSVRSILGQRGISLDWEVIVADGMSEDGTRDILEAIASCSPRLRVVDNPTRTTPAGLNAALQAATGDVILRMDLHTEYADDYVSNCLAVLAETGADNVGGPWIAKGTGVVGKAIAAAFQSPVAIGSRRGHNANYEGPVDTVYLGCWPRRVFDRFGPFDQELIRNQDDEFNLRLAKAGRLIWQSPRIRSYYQVRSSLRALSRQYRQYGYWKVRVIQKHGQPASYRHLIPVLWLLGLFLMPLLGLWIRPVAWLWLLAVTVYAVALVAASLVSARSTGWRSAPVLPVVFACFHLSYGYGFLRGLVDFVALRRSPNQAYTALTRTPGPPAAGI
jgi:glycosyltransferase involved in cell wall biosynthesis